MLENRVGWRGYQALWNKAGFPDLPSGIPAKTSRSCECKPSKDRAGKSECILKFQVPEFNSLGSLEGLVSQYIEGAVAR